MNSDVRADLARWREATAALLAGMPGDLDAPDAAHVHRELRAACDQVLAFAARLLPRVEADGRWAAAGVRSFPEWVAGQRGESVGAARSEVGLGRALGENLPAAAAAVQAGEITLAHARVLARFGPTSQARREALASDLPDRNEASLVAKAKEMGVDEYQRVVKRWAASVDTAAHEREHRAACRAERLIFARRDNGVAFEGLLTVEHGDVVITALRAVAGVPAASDERSTEERRAAALTDLARLVLDKGLAGGGAQVRPHISVHVPWESYRELAERAAERADAEGRDGSGVAGRSGAGEGGREGASEGGRKGAGAAGASGRMIAPAELDGREPIPPSVFARIACDSEITRVVFGPSGQPLDVGRSQRTFAGPQRRAVIARDRHCRYPGCTRPPMLGEVHHIRWWGRDHGTTVVREGILLCWFHHDLVHERDLSIRWTSKGWEFRRVDGTVIAPQGGAPPGGAPPGASVDDLGVPGRVSDMPSRMSGAPPGARGDVRDAPTRPSGAQTGVGTSSAPLRVEQGELVFAG